MSNDFRKVVSPDDIPSKEWIEQVDKLTQMLDEALVKGNGHHEFVVTDYGGPSRTLDKALELYQQKGWMVATIGPGMIRISR